MTPSSFIWGKVELLSLEAVGGELDKHASAWLHLSEGDDHGKRKIAVDPKVGF